MALYYLLEASSVCFTLSFSCTWNYCVFMKQESSLKCFAIQISSWPTRIYWKDRFSLYCWFCRSLSAHINIGLSVYFLLYLIHFFLKILVPVLEHTVFIIAFSWVLIQSRVSSPLLFSGVPWQFLSLCIHV